MIMQEADFDWDDVDDDGNPRRVIHFIPESVRRAYQRCLIKYWDPIVMTIEAIPACLLATLRLGRFIPLLAVFASVGLLGYKHWINLQYEAGDCLVHGLPEKYVPTRGIEPKVSGMYTVLRKYRPSAGQPDGEVEQVCEVVVKCSLMDYREAGPDDDLCVQFQQFQLSSKIECYHHKDDIDGGEGMKLYCLHLPSTLEEEQFTVVISVSVFILTTALHAIVWYREKAKRRAEELEKIAADQADAETTEAKAFREARDLEDAKLQAEAARKREQEFKGNADENLVLDVIFEADE